jgi:hypothetical protein
VCAGGRQAGGRVPRRRRPGSSPLAGERLAALGDEQPGQRVGTGGEIAPHDAPFVPGDGCSTDGPPLRRRTQSRARSSSSSSRRSPTASLTPLAVAGGHEQQEMIAHAVSVRLRGIQQTAHSAGRETMPRALVPIGGLGGAGGPILDVSPVGQLRRHRRNPLLACSSRSIANMWTPTANAQPSSRFAGCLDFISCRG